MNCPNCNKSLSADEMFCLNCGQFIDNIDLSPEKTITDKNDDISHHKHLTQKDIALFEDKEKTEEKNAQTQGKTKYLKNKKALRRIIATFVAFLVLFSFLEIIKIKKTPQEPLVYISDNKISFENNNLKPIDLQKKLLNIDNDFSLSLAISQNQKYFFYGSSNYHLYSKKINSKKDEQVIDSNITNYFINLDASKIIYGKGTDVKLYNGKEVFPLASNVYAWMINKKTDKILFWDYENNLYIQKIKEKSKASQIDENISEVFFVSNDFNNILYNKDDSLILKTSKKSPIKIATDVSGVYATGDDNKFYFVCQSQKNLKLKDFLNDDLAVADSKMQQPQEADFKKQESYTDIWGKPQTRTITDHEALKLATEAYENKLLRDEIRASLDEEIIVQDSSLYYYNGSKSLLISNGVNEILLEKLSDSKKRAIIYTKQPYENIEKLNIEDITSPRLLKSSVESALKAQTSHYIAVDKTESLLTEEVNIVSLSINDKIDTVFYMTDFDYKTKTGSLHRANIKAFKVSENTILHEAIHSYVLAGKKTTNLIYFKSVSSSVGEMYYEGEKLASDVLLDLQIFENTGKLAYLADFDEVKKTGTLYIFDGKKPQKIAEDVSNQNLLNDGDNKLYFFKNYKAKSTPKGDLYVSKNKKAKLINTDVNAFAFIKQSAKFF